MSKSTVVLLLALAIFLFGASSASGVSRSPSHAIAACPGHEAVKLRLKRLSGPRARLSWGAPAGSASAAGSTYRVQRSGETVGQTSASSMVLKITPGRATTYTVQVRRPGVTHACALKLRTTLPFRAPGRVARFRILSHTSTGILLAWSAAKHGDAPLGGYRIRRDGAVVGQTKHVVFKLTLSGGRSHRVDVVAVDTLGHLGAASKALVIAAKPHPAAAPAPAHPPRSTDHPPPDGPTLLAAESVTDTSAALAWNEGHANGATLVGYELFKDGEAVGVVHGLTTTLALASAREYVFTVRALDSDGYLSAPAPELTVLTTHTPPPTPGGLAATQVTSQSATVSWSPSTAVSGTIVGYRVFRDGVPVGQTSTPEMTVGGMEPSSDYEITVIAVDSLGAISPPTQPLDVHTAEPPPTHGNVHAFLLATVDDAFHDLEAHYQQIGVVYPTYFECGSEGKVTGKDDPLVTQWALARKIEVMPRVNCGRSSYEEQALNNPTAREAMIDKIVSLCETYDYDGIHIDFEGAPPTERNPFTAFITLLAQRLHAQGRKLSTTVTAKYYNIQSGRAAMYDDAALSVPSDYLIVLDWGLHWTTSGPGSIDEYAWFKRVAEYTATLPNKSKFMIGMPMYGIDWASGGGSSHPGQPMEFSEITALVSALGVTPEWDSTALSPHFSYTDEGGAHHDVWYTNQQSIGARAELARSLGMGVGLWRLGNEDQSVWELPVLGGGG